MMKGKFIQASLNKCRKMGSKITESAEECESCCQWSFRSSSNLPQAEAETFIPKDVPRGHMVVYVGESHTRYVVKISLLKHPLFRALLDQARDQHVDSSTPPKLWIPCDETIFAHVLRCAR